ncbi:MAG: hypothetical protein K1060chlam5_00255 [Candidatus Anoxychlamydiales bacterium]|nr:hypothetical protein [Candidatus Anoxychlamydiales bacterium]
MSVDKIQGSGGIHRGEVVDKKSSSTAMKIAGVIAGGVIFTAAMGGLFYLSIPAGGVALAGVLGAGACGSFCTQSPNPKSTVDRKGKRKAYEGQQAAAGAAAQSSSLSNIGLPNSGNDCFIISCMQMVMRVETFKNALLIQEEGSELRSFGDFIRKYESGQQITENDIKALREVLVELTRYSLYEFTLDKQHDATEVLKLIAGRLDPKLSIFKNLIETPYAETPIAGQLEERRSNQQKTWGNFEFEINDLPLQFQLNHYFDEEHMPGDKVVNDVSLQLPQYNKSILRTKRRFDDNPQDAFITLKRFEAISDGSEIFGYSKIDKAYDVPQVIMLPGPVEGTEDQYVLDGCIYHMGEFGGGHYIEYHYDYEIKTWFEYNDGGSRPIEVEKIPFNKAYMFHYRKIEK